ncbi:hypothetical protein U1Q18_011989 [Sarracenia purpurea var. burkii]
MGISAYGAYNVYHFPSMVKRRKQLSKILEALSSIGEAVSNSAEAIGVISRDLNEFLQTDSDQIPNSLRQVSKISRSEEFSESVIRVTSALTVGILRGYRSEAKKDDGMRANSSFTDQVLDKLFSPAGSGFASVVVGSFARNLVMGFYSGESNAENSTGLGHDCSGLNSSPEWVNAACGGKCKELIGHCIQLFVSTAVAVYLDKTMHINPYDEFFSGLTNPKHERKMKDILASICNGAVETLVRTSNQVSTSPNSKVFNSISSYSLEGIDEFENQLLGQKLIKARESVNGSEGGGWVKKMSSTLAAPSNRKLILDVTGRITFETVRSFMEFLQKKLSDGMRRRLNGVHEVVVDRAVEVVRLVTAKSSAIATICISLCLHILGGVWSLVPPQEFNRFL